MFQLFEEQATSASQWVLFRSKRDNTTMKPGRKWVQVIKFHHFIVQNYEIPFQVLSSLAAALCQGACGHCVPLSAYVIPQVLHVNPQYWVQTSFPQWAKILYDVWLLVPPADDPKLLLSWRRTQGTRSQWLQKRDPGLVSKLQRALISPDLFVSCNLLFILPASIFVVGCLTGSLVGGYQCDILGRRSYIPFFKDIW